MSKIDPTAFAIAFGERAKCVRLRMRWTQREVADRAGISVSFLSDVENGKRSVSLLNAVVIAGALGTNPSYLIPDLGKKEA